MCMNGDLVNTTLILPLLSEWVVVSSSFFPMNWNSIFQGFFFLKFFFFLKLKKKLEPSVLNHYSLKSHTIYTTEIHLSDFKLQSLFSTFKWGKILTFELVTKNPKVNTFKGKINIWRNSQIYSHCRKLVKYE